MKLLKITGLVLLGIIVLVVIAGVYVSTALPDTGPASDIKIERTATRVERGKYLANNVAVCMDCHSTRDWSLYAGPMMADSIGGGGEAFTKAQGFPGNFYAPNLTPFALSEWTDGEILRAISTGVSKDGRALFPLMGYHRFGKMDEEDVYSIIAYLRTLKPVNKVIPESKADFPVSIIMNTMPKPAAFTKMPPASDRLKYGAYVINVAGCVDCHSQTEKGQIIEGTEFSGGMEFKQPAGIIRSANITFHTQTGIGSWTADQFIQRFKAYADSSYAAPHMTPQELNTPMPWVMYAGMKEDDLRSIYEYLKSLAPIDHKVMSRQKM